MISVSDVPVRLALAGLIGLAIVLGGIAGWLYTGPAAGIAVVLLATGCGLPIVTYAVTAHAMRDPDGTTEAAALLVLGTGALAGLGHGPLTSGIGAVAVVALAEKARIQTLVQWIEEKELRALLAIGRRTGQLP